MTLAGWRCLLITPAACDKPSSARRGIRDRAFPALGPGCACRPCRISTSPASSFETRSSKGLETPGPCVTVLPRAGLDGPVSDGDGRRCRPRFNLVAPASFDVEASGRLLRILHEHV